MRIAVSGVRVTLPLAKPIAAVPVAIVFLVSQRQLVAGLTRGAVRSDQWLASSLNSVSKVYGDGTLAVNRLDLEVADGEFVVFVGPSGCGKTTALRMVAGLEEISEGRPHRRSARQRPVAQATATSRWSSRTTRSIPT